MSNLMPIDQIESQIHFLRGHRVMLDSDLANLYRVEVKQLKRQVRRNIDRFPGDFMFRLINHEVRNLRCQIGTSSWGGRRYLPNAFTEYGSLMAANALNRSNAVEISIDDCFLRFLRQITILTIRRK